MRKTLLTLIIITSGQVLAQNPHLPMTQTLSKGGYEFGSEFEYFQMSERINRDGESIGLLEGEKFNRMQMTFYGQYGFTDNFQMSFDIRARRNEAIYDYNSQFVETDSMGAESAGISFKYAWPYQKGWQWAIEANYRNTIYTNPDYDPNDPEMVLGDDGQDISLGVAVTYLTQSNNFLTGKVLYRNPDTQLSSEIFAVGEFALNWKYLSLFAGGEGNFSLQGDPYTNDTPNKPMMHTGGSELYNSTNREWLAAYAGGGIALGERWRVEFIAKRYLRGTSVDLGDEVMIRLARRTEKNNRYRNYDSEFKEYRVEASIEKIAKENKGVIINKGLASGVSKGMKFDFFKFDYLGGNVLVATGYVIKVSANKAVIQITSRFNKEDITSSLVVRGGLLK